MLVAPLSGMTLGHKPHCNPKPEKHAPKISRQQNLSSFLPTDFTSSMSCGCTTILTIIHPSIGFCILDTRHKLLWPGRGLGFSVWDVGCSFRQIGSITIPKELHASGLWLVC